MNIWLKKKLQDQIPKVSCMINLELQEWYKDIVDVTN